MSVKPTSRPTFALAFETSSAFGSVVLGLGTEILGVHTFSAARRHAVEFLPAVAALCTQHSVASRAVQHVYVSAGPGSFTGLRIGITAARTIALATGAQVVGVPSLEVVAQNAADAPVPPSEVAVILDAKRKRVYAASFARRGSDYAPVSEPGEFAPAAFLAGQSPSCAVLGEGVAYHGEAVAASGLSILPEEFHRPRAETVFRLGAERARKGRFDDPRELIPIYIRPPEAEEKWEERQREGL